MTLDFHGVIIQSRENYFFMPIIILPDKGSVSGIMSSRIPTSLFPEIESVNAIMEMGIFLNFADLFKKGR